MFSIKIFLLAKSLLDLFAALFAVFSSRVGRKPTFQIGVALRKGRFHPLHPINQKL